MPGPSVTAGPEQWARVARYVQRRRLELGLSQDEAGASRSVVSNLESRRQEKYARVSLLRVCRALGWSDDSIERILAGKEPVEAESEAGPSDHDRRLDKLEAELAALRAELGLPPRHRGGQPRSA